MIWPWNTRSQRQNSYKHVTEMRWSLDDRSADTAISPDQQTRTTQLPPVSRLNRSYGERIGRIVLEHSSSGRRYRDHRFFTIVPQPPTSSRSVNCWALGEHTGNGYRCEVDLNFLRTLSGTTTLTIEGGGGAVRGATKHTLNWRLIPAPPGPFVSDLNGPRSLVKGNLAEFEMRLEAPAPEGGVTVQWTIEPSACFVASTTVGVDYTPGTLNELVFEAGQQFRRFALETTSCEPNSAVLRTWTGQRVDRAPFLLQHSFRLQDPET